jgi:hypothetical protein
MKRHRLTMVRLAAVLVVLAPIAAGAGTVTGVSVTPSPAAAGATVTVTVTGTNPCGAAHIIYGDGDAVTYPITGLPTSHAHVYKVAGTFTIVAKGMGNCDGETSTTVRVEGPPPPPPPPPQPTLTAMTLSPQPTRPGSPVTITLEGRGGCTVALDFGDGNTQTVQGELPQRVRHNYLVGGEYAVAAAAQGPCTGAHRAVLRVEAPPPPPPSGTLSGLTLSPQITRPGQAVTLTLEGRGACAVAVDFGDGNTQSVRGELPLRVSHTYAVERTYDITATAQSPCAGSRTARLRVEAALRPRVTDIAARPNPTRENEAVTITVEGQESCTVTVDFGDGNSQKVSGAFPLGVSHNYPLAGSYDIVATGDAPCGGVRTTVLDVRSRR